MGLRRSILLIGLFLVILAATPVAAESDRFNTAGVLYSKSVDLANGGKYEEALKAADDALALNASSLTLLIQANRAGILVVLGRYEDAMTAADAALSSSGNLTTTFSIAYYNKGDALRHLGRINEARAAFARAQELDPTLVPPDLTPVPTRSPAHASLTFAGLTVASVVFRYLRRRI